MKSKLYANMRRLTTFFCVGILCVTASIVALRLTVFSDMAAASESTNNNIITSDANQYRINSKIYFPSATAKGDIFVSNFGEENLIRVQIKLADSGELILSTGLIKPGGSQPSIQMNPSGQKLADGKHDCVAEIAAYKPDDVRASIGMAETEIEVYIGERPEKEKAKDKE